MLGVAGCLALLVCGALGLLASAVLMGGDEAATDEGVAITYGLTLNPSGFDPHIHASNELGIPFFSVYDTLIYRHPQNLTDFVPGLAERWEMGADGLSWTFYLRQGVTFHDGEPFNAQAVAANLDRITNPETRSQKAVRMLGPYTGYEIVDDYTITLNLSEPYAPLLDALSQPYFGIASPAALREYTLNTYQWHQVGTGPYKLAEFVPGDRIILRRNEDYAWGPVFYADVTANSLDTVTFRFYEDPATRGLALESGEVQVIGDLLPTDAELLLGNPELRIFQTEIPGTPQQFFFNTTRAPLDDVAVRRALIHATNRVAIVDTVFQGQSPVAYGPLSAVTPFYFPGVETRSELSYPYNPELARTLLSGAGYTDSDDDGTLDRDGQPLTLRMVFAPWNQMADVAQLVASQWREIGIEVDLVQVPDFTTLVAEANEGNYDVISRYDFAVDPSLLNTYYMTDAPGNWSHFSDPEVDEWLTAGMRQADPAERGQWYAAAQERIMSQAVVLPIRDVVNLQGASSNLDGVIFSAQGWWPLLRNFQWVP